MQKRCILISIYYMALNEGTSEKEMNSLVTLERFRAMSMVPEGARTRSGARTKKLHVGPNGNVLGLKLNCPY